MYQDRSYQIQGHFLAFGLYLKGYPLPFKADEDLVLELTKFLSIRGEIDGQITTGFSVGMRSGPVDELWHKWLMWTGHYIDACNFALGHVVHHAPLAMTNMSPGEWLHRHIRFRGAYRAAFGPVNPVWGAWDAIEVEYRSMLSHHEPT